MCMDNIFLNVKVNTEQLYINNKTSDKLKLYRASSNNFKSLLY